VRSISAGVLKEKARVRVFLKRSIALRVALARDDECRKFARPVTYYFTLSVALSDRAAKRKLFLAALHGRKNRVNTAKAMS
jgi:hypothetical protein